MSEITLKSGKTVTIDVSNLTTLEWRKFIGSGGDEKDEDAVITRCTGLSSDEIAKLPIVEFKAIVKAIVRATQEPLADPN
jgi:hypothetical protein